MQNAGEDRKPQLRRPFCKRLRISVLPRISFISLKPRDGSAPLARVRHWTIQLRHLAGQCFCPATWSSFFCSDMGGETVGIHRFQLLEGVE